MFISFHKMAPVYLVLVSFKKYSITFLCDLAKLHDNHLTKTTLINIKWDLLKKNITSFQVDYISSVIYQVSL